MSGLTLYFAWTIAWWIENNSTRTLSDYGFDATNFRFVGGTLKYAVVFGTVMLLLKVVGLIDDGSSKERLQISAIAIAVSGQETLKNFCAGMLIIIGNRIRVGEYITIDTFAGYVIEVGFLATLINDSNCKRVFIPNIQLFNNSFVNNSRLPCERCEIRFGTRRGADPQAIRNVIYGAALKSFSAVRSRMTTEHKHQGMYMEKDSGKSFT